MLGLKGTKDVNGITYYYITNTGNLTIGPKNDTPMELEHFKYCMVVCCNTTLTMTDKFAYVEFVLEPQSTIKFPYNGTDYSLTNQDVEQSLYIPNIVLLVNTCKFLDTVFADIKVDSEIDKIKAKHFADYNNMDKDLINLFAQQNNMNLELSKVDELILKHYSELSAVAESLSELGSNKSEDTSDCSSYSTESLSKLWSNKSEDGSDCSSYSTESLSKLWSNKSEDGSDCSSFFWELSDVNPSMEGDQAVPLVGTNEGHSG